MEILIKFLGVVALVIIIAILLAFPLKWLWNWLMPLIFDLPRITVIQALGLNILSGILLKSNYGKDK